MLPIDNSNVNCKEIPIPNINLQGKNTFKTVFNFSCINVTHDFKNSNLRFKLFNSNKPKNKHKIKQVTIL